MDDKLRCEALVNEISEILHGENLEVCTNVIVRLLHSLLDRMTEKQSDSLLKALDEQARRDAH